ncbi:hypothetical protein GCM10009808_00940 [Microbacterium sediminicola]|uniref:Nitroreductase family deazaflavin-dependent oxidoreductase n=1 Tax=Microbacterium sediminicola TaxID=415210 RepID=A0ABN2HGX7_9MICO
MSETDHATTNDRGSVVADLLKAKWILRAPIGLYRAGLGWMLGARFVMIEHQGRVSGESRFVVVEVIERGDNVLYVASGWGTKAQWYRNLRANGVAFLSTGRARRVPAHVRLLDKAESDAVLAHYAERHPKAWEALSAGMEKLGTTRIPVVEFTPPTD